MAVSVVGENNNIFIDRIHCGYKITGNEYVIKNFIFFDTTKNLSRTYLTIFLAVYVNRPSDYKCLTASLILRVTVRDRNKLTIFTSV